MYGIGDRDQNTLYGVIKEFLVCIKCCRIHHAKRLEVPASGYGSLSVDIVFYKRRGRRSHSLSCSGASYDGLDGRN